MIQTEIEASVSRMLGILEKKPRMYKFSDILR